MCSSFEEGGMILWEHSESYVTYILFLTIDISLVHIN